VLKLADYAIRIEQHYSVQAGHPVPMDIEWAKDATDGELYIVQARPETVASQRSGDVFESYALTGKGTVLVSGKAVGEKIGKTHLTYGQGAAAELVAAATIAGADMYGLPVSTTHVLSSVSRERWRPTGPACSY